MTTITMEAIEASMEALLDRKLKELKTDIITEIEAKWGPAINKNSQNIAANSTSIEGHDEQLEQLKNDHKDKITEHIVRDIFTLHPNADVKTYS